MNFKQTISKFLKLSQLFLFVGYYGGITLFYHIHIVNGQAVAHSHFYKFDSDTNNPVKKHSHPISAYDIIHELNKIKSERLTVLMPYQQPLLVALPIQRYYTNSDISILVNFQLSSRAPPGC